MISLAKQGSLQAEALSLDIGLNLDVRTNDCISALVRFVKQRNGASKRPCLKLWIGHMVGWLVTFIPLHGRLSRIERKLWGLILFRFGNASECYTRLQKFASRNVVDAVSHCVCRSPE